MPYDRKRNGEGSDGRITVEERGGSGMQRKGGGRRDAAANPSDIQRRGVRLRRYAGRGVMLVQAGVALGVGLAYYILRRPDAMVTRLVRGIWGLEAAFRPTGLAGTVMGVLDGYLADFLWAYALTMTLYAAAPPRPGARRSALCISLLTGALMELMQAAPFVAGTFDVADIAVQAGAACITDMVAARICHEMSVCRTIRTAIRTWVRRLQQSLR